jgi:ribosomal RNA assembly protein
VDKLLATGEYFLKEEERKAKRNNEYKEKQEEAEIRRQVRREKAYIPPEEPIAGPSSSKKAKADNTVDLEALKSKIRKSQQPKKVGNKRK